MNHLTNTPPLSAEGIQAILRTKKIGRPTIVYKEVTSTNTLGFEGAVADTSHGTVILAELQTAGKGRLGRTWHSPYGKNLYFSIVLSQIPQTSHVSWVPLITGIALAESLELISGLPISLKWPNDVMINDKKLAGVLCEGRQKFNGSQVIIVGVGININSNKDDFPEELQQTATSLTLESHQHFDRQTLLAMFLSNFESHYEQFFSDICALRSRYISRCTTLQRSIKVQFVKGNLLEGVAVDIGNEGELHVVPSTNDPLQTPIAIRSGDILHIR